jgi:hypothetical protein
MPEFSTASLGHLASCDVRLHRLFNRVIRTVDCTILEGHRGQARQEEMLRTGKSQAAWPNSKHNSEPSLAVDVAPYPLTWDDRERFCLFAGFVLGVASEMGIPLRWGGDFDMDWEVRDSIFSDLVHYEIVEEP